ncbi:MAG TPA: hypothetical protein DCZ95_03725 [Verrucomicrobia bacterium]|nr:hypothetical protein [Verrucomicrobiota bacterium]
MGGSTGWREYNNIFYACTFAPSMRGEHDYNAYSSDLGETHDQESISTSTFTNYAGDDFTLAAATAGGDDSIGATYNTDMLGSTRGADGTWDRGAYEYVDGEPTPTPTPTPTPGPTTMSGGGGSGLSIR